VTIKVQLDARSIDAVLLSYESSSNYDGNETYIREAARCLL